MKSVREVMTQIRDAHYHGLPPAPSDVEFLKMHSRLATAQASQLAVELLDDQDACAVGEEMSLDQIHWLARSCAHHARKVLAALECAKGGH